MTSGEQVPADWENPEWSNERVHNWHNYISKALRAMWHTFNNAQKQLIAMHAEERASNEEWD